MARSQDPNSAGSQFFVCLGRNLCQHLDREYTAVGCVTSGIESVREIGTCDVGPGDEPRERQGIISVTVLSEG
ncbi:MAG: peptidylprolyl isomerase [Planctomycetota bacterium]|nr:peptidylprolyl isomerase [Planctomycetota bacterium]